MRTEREKMLSGELYDPSETELVEARLRARRLLHAFNGSGPDEIDRRQRLIRELVPEQGEGLHIEPPFQCDYGTHMKLGARVYFNFDCVVLDCAPVVLGDDVLVGPAVQIYTATHPVDHAIRVQALEFALPVHIGDAVWIGGGAIICPGVRIGARTVIGAGSVVTRDLPDDVVAAGNPCRILRRLS